MDDALDLATRLAQLHAQSGLLLRHWTPNEYLDLLAQERTILTQTSSGFAIGQSIGIEAELLMIVVHPERRQQGEGHALLHEFEASCRQRNISELYLEVGESNLAARGLYSKAGFQKVGLRKDYYTQTDGTRDSAVIMLKNFK